MQAITPEIAEIAGLFAADGSMQEKHICFWGHITEEKEYYDTTLRNLFKHSFGIDINPHEKRSNSVYGFYICRKEILEYFKNILGFKPGNKKYTISVPKLILNSSDKKVWIAFIRGFTDGDGCLSFDRRYSPNYRKILTIVHTYPRIHLESVSFDIINEVSYLLQKLDIKHIVCKIEKNRENEKAYLLIQISGMKRLRAWMKTIGFNNPVQQTRFLIFKKFGFVPPRTTLADRKAILAMHKDPLTFYPKEARIRVLDQDILSLKKSSNRYI